MFPADKKRVESALASAHLPKGKVGNYKHAGMSREEKNAHTHSGMKQTWWHMCVYFSMIPWNLMSSLRLPSRCFWTTSALVLKSLRSSPLSESDRVASWHSRIYSHTFREALQQIISCLLDLLSHPGLMWGDGELRWPGSRALLKRFARLLYFLQLHQTDHDEGEFH